MSTDDKVNKFLSDVLSQIKDWLEQRKVKRLVMVLNSVETKEVLERWEFKIESEKGKEGDVVEKAVKDEKKIKSEIRDVIRQITASVTFLPLLDCLCSFDILIYTGRLEIFIGYWFFFCVIKIKSLFVAAIRRSRKGGGRATRASSPTPRR